MFTKKSFALLFLCSFIVLAAFFASSLIVVGAESSRPAAAAVIHTANYKVAGESTDHIIFQVEPTPALPGDSTLVPTLEPVPTDEPTPTPVPPPDPSAPGGVLATAMYTLIGVLIGAVTMLLSVLTLIGRLKNDAIGKTTIERLIDALANSVPAFAPVKPLLNKTGEAMVDAGGVLKDVTDGQPNL